MCNTDLQAKLKGEGKWGAYLARKAELLDSGMAELAAYEQAYDEFVPPDTPARVGSVQEKDSGFVPLATFIIPEKRVKPKVDVQWVYDNMCISDIEPSDAPSPGAWGLLQACRNSGELFRDFYRTIWPKLLPSKTEIDGGDRFTDDNRNIFELIERAAGESEGGTEEVPDILVIA